MGMVAKAGRYIDVDFFFNLEMFTQTTQTQRAMYKHRASQVKSLQDVRITERLMLKGAWRNEFADSIRHTLTSMLMFCWRFC